jgi:hypothetical protein
LNKIVNNYWNRVVLVGNPWTCSNTRNTMETPKIKSHVRCHPRNLNDLLQTSFSKTNAAFFQIMSLYLHDHVSFKLRDFCLIYHTLKFLWKKHSRLVLPICSSLTAVKIIIIIVHLVANWYPCGVCRFSN